MSGTSFFKDTSKTRIYIGVGLRANLYVGIRINFA